MHPQWHGTTQRGSSPSQLRVLQVAEGVARHVGRRLVRSTYLREREDVVQDAALAALEVTARTVLDYSGARGATVKGYMWRAATREVGLSLSRRRAVVSISEGQATNKEHRREPRRLNVSGFIDVPGSEGDARPRQAYGDALLAPPSSRPDARLRGLELLRAREQLRRRVRRNLDRYLALLPGDQRAGVEALLGRSGPEAADESEAARTAGVSERAVRKGMARIKRLAAGDFELRRLQRALDLEED